MPGSLSSYTTDLSKWRLHVDLGRQWWSYEQEPSTEQSFLEKHLLTKKSNDEKAGRKNSDEDEPGISSLQQAVEKAFEFYSKIQTEDGHWTGDYGGPMFLLPGLVITMYITNTPLEDAFKTEMKKYLLNQQHKDGGWGTHIEGPSTIFGTTLNYIAARLLGLDRDEISIVNARSFLHKNGGAVGCPAWGKFWMSALGVYDWSGLNPVLPELWYLPSWIPLHPSKLWCHCRVVYLPMAYIYGGKLTAKDTPLIESLREELYVEPYDKINWTKARTNTHPMDIYNPLTPLMRVVNKLMYWYESIAPSFIRRRAMECAYDHIVHEDKSTDYICIGPVNKMIDMLCTWYREGPNSEGFKRHKERIVDYLWISDDGMKMQGYNGSQLWDSSFAMQALYETGMCEKEKFRECMKKAHSYLECSQVLEDVDEYEKYFRHVSKGGWPFSTRDHGWPITDCTSEGVKATLKLQKLSYIDPTIDAQRLYDAVNVILTMRNAHDGGWATYEQQRGSGLLELLNPSEVFGDIMVDYSYVECTSACLTALVDFRKMYPKHRSNEVNRAIQEGAKFIKSIQRSDGSWYGSWGVCFTYAAWFGIEGLLAAGESPDSPAVRKACKFLLDKQLADGGWGENYTSCTTKQYQSSERSQIVMTAWAVLALLAADHPDKERIAKGVELLRRRQLANGDFPQETITGVFNRSCMITYTAYRNIFPIWAMGRWLKKRGDM